MFKATYMFNCTKKFYDGSNGLLHAFYLEKGKSVPKHYQFIIYYKPII